MQSNHSNRRVRVPLSCDPCRARKLRCNREWPCQNCSARDDRAAAGAACKFRGGAAPRTGTESAGGVAKSSHSALSRHNGGGGGGDATLRQRINDLEDMVSRLIESQAANDSSSSQASTGLYTPPDSGSSTHCGRRGAPEASSDGRIVLDREGRSVYHGWDVLFDMLEEINKLRDLVIDGGVNPAISNTVDGPSLLFIQPKPIECMISGLPPKGQVDALVSHFFAFIHQPCPLPIPPILHQPTFLREYEENWKDLSRTGFMWLGLIYSMLAICMLVFRAYGEPPEYQGKSEALLQLYRKRAAQCLQSGDIAKCLPYTVETLRLHAVAEGHRGGQDNIRGLWILAGVIVRTAINMGYHREPTRAIPVIQAEYRRRIWYSVISMDEYFSFSGGFPYTTPTRHSDTAEPSNLHDWELTDDTAVLPPSRPLTEATSITYWIAKSRLTHVLGRVADFDWGQGPHENLVEIDEHLQDTYLNLPPHMKLAIPGFADNDDVVDDAHVVYTMSDWNNLSLLANFLKGTCVLHRRSLTRARVDARFSASRDRCISTALDILAVQRCVTNIYYGLFEARQLLTLGALTLILELGLRQKDLQVDKTPSSSSSSHSSGVLLRALQESCASWAKAASAGYEEAARVHRVLDRVLCSLRGPQGSLVLNEAEGPTLVASASPQEVGIGLVEPTIPTWLNTMNGMLDFEKELPDVDFDWTSWDAFLGTSGPEVGGNS